MENFAKRLALNHNVSFNGSSRRTFPDKTVEENFKNIKRAYELLTESIEKNVPIPPSGEWLLDNFYIIEELVNSIRNSLNEREYVKLPSVYGVARVYLVAIEFVDYTDGVITKQNIESFFNAYQSKKILSQGEIYEIPLMIQIALVKHIGVVANKIITGQLQKFKVESLVERIIDSKEISTQKFREYKNINLNNQAEVYVEYLIYLLRKMGKTATPYLDVLEEEIAKKGTSSYEIIKTEHYDMAIRRVSISNAILSIKNIMRIDYKSLFEKINFVEKLMCNNESYIKLDDETKELYRNKIKKLSDITNTSEIYVTEKLLEVTRENSYDMSEFLFGDLEYVFYDKLGYKRRKVKFSNGFKLFLYIISIYIPALIVSISIGDSFWWVLFIPTSEAIVQIVNRIISKLIAPRRLLRYEKIDDDIKTFVIVPTLLNSADRVKKMFENIEIYYLNNRESNLLFCLLGDASEEKTEKVKHDEIVIKTGLEESKRLNEKYNTNIFHFLYRKRVYSETQDDFLGYERKRGMIEEFNNFLITGEQGTFIVNTIKEIEDIKYVITLDADTELIMESAKKLIGTMEHPFNRAVINNGIVVKGYGLIQPKVDLSLAASHASVFSNLFAGNGGFDIYSTAESNVYQDLFGEAIFTGKGIYNLKVFNGVLKNEILENLILSHDLLEGSYVRVGLASDVKVIDGFPAKVNSYFLRMHRWIRGDWQIISWLKNKKINAISKYKIFDNLRRSTVDIFLLASFFCGFFYLPLVLIFFDVFLGVRKKLFITRKQLFDTFLRCSINLITLPYKAVLEIRAIFVTLYRLIVSKKNLLEWTTADDAERMLKNDLRSYIKEMIICPEIGLALILTTILYNPLSLAEVTLLFIMWYSSPFVSYTISKTNNKEKETTFIDNKKSFFVDVANRTWNFFDNNTNEKTNYLMMDNYDEQRAKKAANYTSSTNIGLSIIAVISAYDLKFISKEAAIKKLDGICKTIDKLDKWNGHLYNWYTIQNLKPIKPEFVSTVDSGNFISYIYVLKGFLNMLKLEEQNSSENNTDKGSECNIQNNIKFNNDSATIDWLLDFANKMIDETDFSKLYCYDNNLFSIGFNIQENRLIDSYYDLLASEARTASFVAIAKKDISYKHWFYLGRTITSLDNKSGLASWSGTMFEYLMPDILMNTFKQSLINQTYKFCVYCQKEYAKKLDVPWGISEAAYNLKDLNYNYQYKALGVPWLGLKRGLDEDVVVAPYATALAVNIDPEGAYKNLERLKRLGAYDEYGFYESIDFTPGRTDREKHKVVKTYMAHHQGLILAAINNLVNNNALKKYFSSNQEIKATEILLQEKFPQESPAVTNAKNKIKELKYVDYEDFSVKVINEIDNNVNVLSNDNSTLLINDYGEGYFKINNIFLSKYKDDYRNSNHIYIKNLNTNESFATTYLKGMKAPDKYQVKFSSYESSFYRKDGEIESITNVMVSSEENLLLKQVEVKNNSKENTNLRMVFYMEPILCELAADIAHPAYNGMFISMREYNGKLIVERKSQKGNNIYCGVWCNNDKEFNVQHVLDKTKIIGRCRGIENPIILENDVIQNSFENSATPAVAINSNFALSEDESVRFNFYMYCSEDIDDVKSVIDKYNSFDSYKRISEMAMSRSIVENRFYGFNAKEVFVYNKLLSHVMFGSASREKYYKYINDNKLSQRELWKFGISGDLPMIAVSIASVKDVYVIKQLVKAIEYFNLKKVKVDLVIIDDEQDTERYVEDKVKEYVSSRNINYLLNVNAGIHIIDSKKMNLEERKLIYSCSDVIFDAKDGFLKEQLEE